MGLFNIFKKNKKEKNTFNLEKMLETKNKNYIFFKLFFVFGRKM